MGIFDRAKDVISRPDQGSRRAGATGPQGSGLTQAQHAATEPVVPESNRAEQAATERAATPTKRPKER